MEQTSLLFYILSSFAIAGALGVIMARHPVYAVLSLVAALFSLSGIFLLLHAYFVAAIQVLVYAGAILVLFLFVVMLVDMAPERLFRLRTNMLNLGGALFGLVLLWEIVVAACFFTIAPPATGAGTEGTTAAVGALLFTRYALPFEVASLLLLAGIIGAIVLAKKRL
ncbi:MAG: NADH-quinone oxidoreductase subunit J [Candidatus Omnitrophica bacterium]|nr:NADH-quinone oxidoreductase subunit J [Candidatus Omnitrophota bacterium]